ncbi:MAG: hypothetical protein HOY75_08300 [Streptomyces sp.]|nr:hypothetical protein [Streptomyces sp.]
MNPPAPHNPGPGAGPGDNRTELQMVIDDMEKFLYPIGASLTNEETAAIVRRTLDIVDEIILIGAQGTGIITETQRTRIAELLEGLKLATKHAAHG